MKILISKIQSVTGRKIKKSFVSLGFDIAKRTGICEIKVNTKYIYLDWGFIEFDSSDKKNMYKQMLQEFDQIIQKQDFSMIEDTFVGFNRKGAIELSRYGAFAIATCIRKGINWDLITAVSARANLKIDTRKFGKGKSKLAVADWLKTELDIELEDEDISDAIVLAINGILK